MKAVIVALLLVAAVDAWWQPGGCTSRPRPGEIPPLAHFYYDQFCGRSTPVAPPAAGHFDFDPTCPVWDQNCNLAMKSARGVPQPRGFKSYCEWQSNGEMWCA
ncbi:hypothetical protein QR680_012201 [Steinernema hermaphroditum]|uniref:Secreted protein n=1 Tax=Steinernema hermaphroditum TaxID=289476 RepID=A0AA39M052_9BILA|nr:hypothetical protein QR680_012201 [Steinernema hermaphroditum]